MFRLISITFLFASFHSVLLLPFLDRCLQVKVMNQFDVHKFSGKWYEILRNNISIPVTTKCHEEAYEIPEETFLVISGKFMDSVTNKYKSIEGVGVDFQGQSGTMAYNIPVAHAVGIMSVIDTDYETYAALFVCNTYDVVAIEHFWIVSRERKLSEDIIKKLLSEYEAMGGDVSRMIYIDQTSCPSEVEKDSISKHNYL